MIGIVGAGAFGTALAIAWARSGAPVRLWARDAAQRAEMAAARENRRHLAGARFPDALDIAETLSALDGAAAVILAVPAQATAGLLETTPVPGGPLVLAAKGIAAEGAKRQSELVPPGRDFAVLTGPSFAGEIAAGLPTALTLAGEAAVTARLQEVLGRPALRLYRTEDVIGAELGGALKNVVAIAAGITMGAGLGESARAAVMTRGFAEVRRLAVALGAREATLMGLSGFGDLALTAGSEKSRNYACGLAIGRGAARPGGTVEGAPTAGAAVRLAAASGLEMPIAEAVRQVLAEEVSVSAAAEALLARPMGEE